jgi:hypothetical protein
MTDDEFAVLLQTFYSLSEEDRKSFLVDNGAVLQEKEDFGVPITIQVSPFS